MSTRSNDARRRRDAETVHRLRDAADPERFAVLIHLNVEVAAGSAEGAVQQARRWLDEHAIPDDVVADVEAL